MKFLKYHLVILFSVLFSQVLVFAQRVERSEAFIIKAMPNYYKVVSPVRLRGDQVAVILQNKTLSSIRGKFVNSKEENLKFITVKSGEEESVEFKFNRKDKFYFIPLDPAFQKVILNIGKSAYEIPSQE